ncbi:Hypothetical_protein [Hexamita inflata]|uniref:Hypothetical_protein n=1 Tax=Hexamita inflata TaxID=28002 RepID=A0AA86UQD5_9EUKA|nr:Hypothetical protein HINF_LOCUS55215 [Hexamita inflata]
MQYPCTISAYCNIISFTQLSQDIFRVEVILRLGQYLHNQVFYIQISFGYMLSECHQQQQHQSAGSLVLSLCPACYCYHPSLALLQLLQLLACTSCKQGVQFC